MSTLFGFRSEFREEVDFCKTRNERKMVSYFFNISVEGLLGVLMIFDVGVMVQGYL